MKNYIYTSVCILVMLLSSCKNENGGGGIPGDNTFIIDGVSYKADDVFYIESSNSLRVQKIWPGTGLNNIESITVEFSDDELPTIGGDFKIVSDPYSPGDHTNNDEVSVIRSSFPHDYGSYVDNILFNAKLSPEQHITVTIVNGKINVKLTDIKMADLNGNICTVSANFTQK